jgi:outer membrane lipoprotein-sorting protein
MNILRRMPLRRLLVLCAGIVALGAVGTAFGTSLGSSPKPAPQPLANALHQALVAPAVPGVSARIKFTNNLIVTSSLNTGDGPGPTDSPLLSGADGRLWVSSDGRARLELQSSAGDSQLIWDGHTISFYDASSNSLYRYTPPAQTGSSSNGQAEPQHAVPTVQKIQDEIATLMQHVTISGAIPSDVAGRPAYTVRISPSHDGGLIGAAALAWDAVNGTPLRVAVYATGNSTPVLELKATHISYRPVSDSVFAFSPPPGARITDVQAHTAATASHRRAGAAGHRGHAAEVKGRAAVQAQLPFTLSAPATLVGLPQHGVELLSFGGRPAALVTYGQGLGGIAVIEHQAPAQDKQQAPNPHSLAGELPKISINRATGTELATALGTLLQFERNGVSYVIVGSVPPKAAEAAARGL